MKEEIFFFLPFATSSSLSSVADFFFTLFVESLSLRFDDLDPNCAAFFADRALRPTSNSISSPDDTAFEKQSARFALAISDIVLINMWCHDIGREQAANNPLLKIVFQTPLENLEPVLREDIQKIWDSVPKPQAHKETPLSDFFNVEVVALSSYEEKEEQFKEQVVSQLALNFGENPGSPVIYCSTVNRCL